MYGYSCIDTCGMLKHCGNKFCSAHPEYNKVRSKDQFRKGKSAKKNWETIEPWYMNENGDENEEEGDE